MSFTSKLASRSAMIAATLALGLVLAAGAATSSEARSFPAPGVEQSWAHGHGGHGHGGGHGGGYGGGKGGRCGW